jgi:hypothetical protein
LTTIESCPDRAITHSSGSSSSALISWCGTNGQRQHHSTSHPGSHWVGRGRVLTPRLFPRGFFTFS